MTDYAFIPNQTDTERKECGARVTTKMICLVVLKRRRRSRKRKMTLVTINDYD